MNSDAITMGKSLLEKPLSLLTEDDIAQITREECRRFLKDRGMRRPSWNKSQAIQQVISLKALFENRSDLEDPPASVRIARNPPQISLPSPTMNAIGSGDSQRVPPQREIDPSPYRRKDPIQLAGKSQQSNFPPFRDFSDRQLTIFFAGKVSVYDGVPPAKAREIMQLAANSDKDDATTVGKISSALPFLNRFAPVYSGPAGVARCCQDSPAGKWQRNVEEGRASRESVPECPTSRKASLKRYREKKKDRYKGRRKFCGSSSSSMELMHLSQKFSGPGPIEPSSRSNSSSSMQPRPPWSPLSRCTSIETKKLGFSVDLNDDGAGGH